NSVLVLLFVRLSTFSCELFLINTTIVDIHITMMKIIEVFLLSGIIWVASAELLMANPRNDPPTTINQHFMNFIHNERVNFPCGWPDSQMAPIEPYRIDELSFVIDSASEFTGVDFRMTNADMTGQHNMCFNDFDLQVTGLILRFSLTMPRLNIVGRHRTFANMVNGGVTIPISGEGSVVMGMNNVRVTSVGQMRTMPNGNLNLDQLVSTTLVSTVDTSLTGFGALDGAVSRMISAAAPQLVNERQAEINEALRTTLIPGINRFLNQHTLVSLVNLMADRTQNPPPRRCFVVNPRTCS
ncbi:CLUMA_CG005507, isoform A, partial [Clunio marinus]